ncbi:MAG: FMN-binding protein [Proteobacteria bacterium]|nr:FMN-binding protein [Pseudomonadota bacterium]
MREKVRMVLVLVVLSALSAILLALIDYVSSDMIEENRERGMKLAVLSALSVPLEGRTAEEVFGRSIKKIKTEAGMLYFSEEEGNEGAAFKISGPGFWGPISMLLAIDIKDLSIRGLEILEQGETPGLGARIEEVEFRKRFKWKSVDQPLRVRSQAEGIESNDVAAITGATISSKAVERIINEASRPYIEAIRSLKHD